MSAGVDHEQDEQAGREQRIAAEVEPVRDRWNGRVDELVEDDVRDREAAGSPPQKEPWQRIVRPVEPDADRDRERRADADEVVEVVLDRAARDREIDDDQDEAGGEEDRAGAEIADG